MNGFVIEYAILSRIIIDKRLTKYFTLLFKYIYIFSSKYTS